MTECKHENLLPIDIPISDPGYTLNGRSIGISSWCKDCGALETFYEINNDGDFKDDLILPGDKRKDKNGGNP